MVTMPTIPCHRRLIRALCALLLAAGSPGLTAADHDNKYPLARAKQMVLVTARHWNSTEGSLRRFERPTDTSRWSPVDAPVAVTLGRKGLAWGRGEFPLTALPGPQKREGDGRSPAGIFKLTELFGTAETDSTTGHAAKLPYRPATSDLICVDDSASRYYNRIIDRTQTESVDWTSHEEMRRQDGQYAIGVVVAHNASPTVAAGGSCIFIHVWRGPGQPTAGCTAGDTDHILALAGWLDEAQHPVLVQLPDAEYRQRRKTWQLP